MKMMEKDYNTLKNIGKDYNTMKKQEMQKSE
jgi:hypothetical protein